MPTGFDRHLVGKTLINVCYSVVTYTPFRQINDHVDIFLKLTGEISFE